MTKSNQTAPKAHDLIDLGAITSETKGGAPYKGLDGTIVQFRDTPGMAHD